MIPELELLKIRLQQVGNFLGGRTLGRVCHIIGTFVLVFIMIGAVVLGFALFNNINPTLVLSVIAAPLWIGIVFIAARIVRMIHRR